MEEEIRIHEEGSDSEESENDSAQLKDKSEEAEITAPKMKRQKLDLSKLRSEILNKQGQNYKFYCSICDDKFLFESTWKRHLESHSGESSSVLLKCTFCSKTFDREENLLSHKLKKHKKIISMHKCRMCNERFDSVKELNLHCVTHFSSGNKRKEIYQCKNCQKLFPSNCELKSHMSKHDSIFICPCCKKEFLNRDYLIRHVVLHKNIDSTYKCLKCEDSFINPNEVSSHMIEKHGSECDIPVCTKCDREFESHQQLDYHLRIHFGSKPYFCDKSGCKKYFGLKEHFEVHQKGHEGEKPYQCLKCLKCFNRLEHYKTHLLEHVHRKESPEASKETQKQDWKCEKCSQSFESVFELHNHNRKIHKGSNSCLLCSQKFSTNSSLSVHLRRHLNIKLHKCSECGRRFTESNELTRHIFTHVSPKDRPHICPHTICPKKFVSNTELKYHLQTHEGKTFECQECDKKYSRSDLLKAHIRDNHSDKDPSVSCTNCGKIFKNRRACNLHMKSDHSNEQYECQKCGWITLSEAALKIHMKDRHLEIESGETSCEICNKIYANKKTLRDHQKRVHEEVGEYSCGVCQNMFVTQYSLDIHSKCHKKETEKEFRCLKCIMIFNSEEEFENHQQIHLEENSSSKPSKKPDYRDKAVSCEICKKWCRGKWWLDVHMRSHTNDRPFKCSQENCEQAFRTNNALKNHQKVHTKEKRFSCNVCSKSFAEKKSLKLHSYLHSGERPYDCEICGRGFITNHFLKTHTFKHIKAGETKENFSAAKREVIKRQQEIKQVQAQLKHGNVSESLQINIDLSGIDVEELAADDQEKISLDHKNEENPQDPEEDLENLAIDDIIEYDETGGEFSDYIEISVDQKPLEIIENPVANESLKTYVIQEDLGDFKEDDIIIYESENEENVQQAENQEHSNIANTDGKIDYIIETMEIPMIQQSRIVFSHNVCPYCKQVCQNSDLMEQHINDQHVKERPHCCIICGYRFKVKSKLERHYKIHLNDKKYECEVCNMKFSEKYSLNTHKALHTDNPKPYKCLCGTGFRNQTSLNVHKYTCHILKIQGLEIKDFKDFDEIREFVNSESGKEPMFSLDNCEISVSDFKCGYCEKSFHALQSLEFHLLVHKQESLMKQYSCDFCNFKTTTDPNLQRHLKLCHSENMPEEILSKQDKEQMIPCHICSKVMARCRVDRHVKLVHSRTYYRCPQENCRKLVNTLKKIVDHIKIHEEPQNQSKETKIVTKNAFQCEICSAILSSVHCLKRHQDRHFNERRFSCKICSERFFSKHTKMAHVVKEHGLEAAEIDANFILG